MLFKHIMVPIDLGARNQRALETALALARYDNARVTLFHVIERVPGIATDELQSFYRRLVTGSERRLRQAARPFSRAGINVDTEVRVGAPAAEIIRAARDKRVDLLIMGSHRVKPGPRAAGWGTTSYKVGIFCRCPILLIK